MAETIHYKLQDDVSAGLSTIQDRTRALDKDTQELEARYQKLQKELKKLTREQSAWNKALAGSGRETEKARQEYEQFTDLAGGEEAGAAADRQRELREELEKTREALRENRKELEDYQKTGEKGVSLTDKGTEAAGGQGKEKTLLGKLGKAGVFKPLTDSVGGAVTAGISSAMGDQAGAVMTSSLSGAVSGAVAGAGAGIPGIIVGGIIGLISGLISGKTKEFEAQDAAFKEYYTGLYDTVRQKTKTAIQSGSALAASREAEETALKVESGELDASALTKTYQAVSAELTGTRSDLEARYGTGYNKERQEGISAEQAAYGGELGEALGALNEITGSNQAYMDNLSEQYTREALEAVLMGKDLTQEDTVYDQETAEKLRQKGEEYAQLKAVYDAMEDPKENPEVALKMEALKEEAEALATTAYESSDQYQLVQQTELDQIEAIRENTAALSGWQNKYRMDQEKTKGIMSTKDDTDFTSGMDRHDARPNGRPTAFGLDRVPYDNYAVLLHEGERVLTAREARQQDRGAGSVTVQVMGNEFQVRSESDLDAIGDAIASAVQRKLMAGVSRC